MSTSALHNYGCGHAPQFDETSASRHIPYYLQLQQHAWFVSAQSLRSTRHTSAHHTLWRTCWRQPDGSVPSGSNESSLQSLQAPHASSTFRGTSSTVTTEATLSSQNFLLAAMRVSCPPHLPTQTSLRHQCKLASTTSAMTSL